MNVGTWTIGKRCLARVIRPQPGRGPIVVAAVTATGRIMLVAGLVAVRAAFADAKDAPAASVSAPVMPPRAAGAPLPPPPEVGDAPVLDLQADGFSVGSLLDAPAGGDGPRTTLLWKSDLCATPLELSIPEIVRIRFPRREAPAVPPSSWRFELGGGDAILGALEGIEGEWFTVSPLDVGATGPLRIRRGAVARMRRLQGGVRTIVPGGLEGWDAVRGVWQEQAGTLSSDRPNAVAYRDVGAPAKACYDLVLSWTARPDFDLHVATDAAEFARLKAPAPGKKPNDVEEYRLQAIGGKVQAWREGAKADFGEIAPLDPAGGSLHVQVFVDQEKGRMVVMVPVDGQPVEKPAFDKTVAPRKAAARPGFSIKLRKGTVRIDRLRIVPWDGEAPRLEAVAGLGSPTAVLESFDKAAGEFVVRDGTETRRVAAAAVGEIEFPAAPAAVKPAVAPAEVLLGFAAGSRLTGAIREIGKETVTLDSPALEGPLACPIGRLALLEPVAPAQPRSLPGRVGLLESAKDRMLGCVGSADGVGWQAWGAVAPARFAPSASAKISYRGTPLLGGAGISLAKQGNTLSVAEIAPGGPAARDGRIQRGWKLEAIQLLPGGQPLPAAGLKIEDVVALLRGIVGSSVGLRLTDAAGQAQELTLVRDRAGRGDVTNVSEQDLLEAALRVHDERNGIKAGAGPGGSLITLKTGDAIVCTVLSANADGLNVKTDRDEILVPGALVRAAELVNAPGMPITPQKMERLTTLPRMQLADPPTHLIRLASGDYLRGKLLSLDAKTARFKVLEETKELPRESLARIIWLTVAGDNADQKAVELLAGGAGLPVQSVNFDKRRLTVAAQRFEDGRLIGTAGPLGQLQIDLRTSDTLLLGGAISAQPATTNSFKQWELKPAKPPAALLKK